VRQVIGIFVAASVLVGAAFVLYAWVLSTSVASPQDRASFGEMFGMLGALFSALAFAAVTCSIVIQYQQLRDQRESAEETQRQVARQLQLAADTTAELAKTSKLNALAILAKTYTDSLSFLAGRPGDTSSPTVDVMRQHRRAIQQVEQMAGISEEEGFYYEPPPPAHRPGSGSFTFKSDAAPPADQSDR
jgi:ABC-type multidrug transport system fused ATPase/permease subunit